MGQVLSLPIKLLQHTKTYYIGFFYYLWGNGRKKPYTTTTSLFTRSASLLTWNNSTNTNNKKEEDEHKKKLFEQHARIHLYSLTSNFYLYKRQHYRKSSYRLDLMDNLRNVAIPGTGIPLHYILAYSRLGAFSFLLTAYPVCALISSIHLWFKTKFQSSISTEYAIRLLAPNDWFHYWRLNCSVVGLHALLNPQSAVDYTMENKWTFLQTGDVKNVPISPFLKNCSGIVVKHKNEEGGLGIYFYQNAVYDGDWIIQERINNSQWVSNLLPPNAPLSTFRVITASRNCISSTTSSTRGNVHALSCVFRAGRQNAATDHDSILFDVDMQTGTIQGGTTNAHWYKLGFYNGLLRSPWRSYDEQRITNHPDALSIQVTGNDVPNFQHMLQLVEQSHYDMCPTVPLAGWDVVFSDDHPNLPICLLEVNLSCNFFRGTFDEKLYFNFLDDVFTKLQDQRLEADKQKT